MADPTRSPDQQLAVDLAVDAGRLLVDLRTSGPTRRALGDLGDRRANTLILDRLAAERPGDAVLSEESRDDPARVGADRVWIIDPVDGTREYGLGDRPDWAVHVALWEPAGAVLSATTVDLPAQGLTRSVLDDVSAPAPLPTDRLALNARRSVDSRFAIPAPPTAPTPC